jgi:hypothetical protein
VHNIGHDVLEQALVVGDDDHRAVGRAQRVDAVGDDASAHRCRGRNRSRRARKARRQQFHLQDFGALLLAAGEADIERTLEHVHGLTFRLAAASLTSFMKSGVFSSSSPRALRCSFIATFRNCMVATPGISIGYWNARNMPAAARSDGFHFENALAIVEDVALGDLVVVRPARM